MLHSSKLKIPVEENKIKEFSAPLPPKFSKLLNSLLEIKV